MSVKSWYWMVLSVCVLLFGCKKKSAPPIDDLQSLQSAHTTGQPVQRLTQKSRTQVVQVANASGTSNRSHRRARPQPRPRFRSHPRPRRRLATIPSGAIHFGFDRGMEGWRGWGGGEGRRQVRMGYRKPGSLLLSSEDGRRSYTFYRKVRKLRPGLYRVSAWLRALDVKQGKWDVSVWVFADGGKGIQSPVKNLKGTFDWSRVTYTIRVTKTTLGLWFRLKSQGQLWVDDVMVVPYRGAPISYRFQASKTPMEAPATRGHGRRCQRCYRWWASHHAHCSVCGGTLQHVKRDGMFAVAPTPPTRRKSKVRAKQATRMLFDFEVSQAPQEQQFHGLRTYRSNATSGRRSAAIWYGTYNNFVTHGSKFNWSGYQNLAMDVYNPLSKQVMFQLCINDKKRSGYWDQMNHVARLVPGWNRLRFSLQQYVGERGSVRIQRFVNLSTIRRLWFAVGAEAKVRYPKPFLVDNIRLEQGSPAPQTFPGLYRFDFVAQRFRTQRGFVGVTPLHHYHKAVGFGFQHTTIWRLLDSKYADTLLRDAILTNQGEFVVDVPNGSYTVHLYAKHLGLWYEHFWTQRKIEVNGTVLVNDTRRDANDYLRDRLRFQDVIPQPKDDAYSLYLQKLLAPYTATVQVTKGRLVFRWKGDSSGVALNALVLYPSSQEKKGRAFLKSLVRVQREEFAQVARQIQPLAKKETGAVLSVDHKRGFYAPLIPPSSYIRHNWLMRSQGRSIVLEGGRGQRPLQALMVRSFQRKGTLRVSVSPLRSKGGVIAPKQMMIRYGVSQFVCHEINHETYVLAPRFLRDIPKQGLTLPARQSLLVWLHIPLSKRQKPGVYRGFLSITMHGKSIRYPIQLTVHPFTLPSVDIPVGYFGFDPMSFAYFKGKGTSSWSWKWRQKVLRILRDRGFSSWTSLPKGEVSRQGGRLRVDTSDADRLMKAAHKMGFRQPVFTYGGGVVDALLNIDQRGDILGMSQQQYRRASAKILRRVLAKRSWLPIVYNYSDEASGYSQKVDRDSRRATLLQKHYPFLKRGGFTHSIAPGKYGDKLNLTMTDISLSSVMKTHADLLRKQKKRWGFYNAAIGPFETGQATFGEGLFAARLNGATHRIAWHWSSMQNYPYYDLDGRESDAMMVFPRTDGQLNVALKLEWAAHGLEDYRLLLLLQRLAKRSGSRGRKALMWIARNYREVNFFGSPNYLQIAQKRYTDKRNKAFRKKVYRMILELTKLSK